MKKSFVCIAILTLATALTSEAQYFKLLKGQGSPFDTAVAVRIDRYRLESAKIKLADRAIDSLEFQIGSMWSELAKADSIESTYRAQIFINNTATARKDSTIQILSTNLNKLLSEIPEPAKWYRKPETWGVAGLILGLILSR